MRLDTLQQSVTLAADEREHIAAASRRLAPAGFVQNLLGALSFHTRPFGLDIWAMLPPRGTGHIGLAEAPALVIVTVIVLGTVLMRSPAGDLGGALFQGCAAVFAALLFARYATSSYYAFVCAIVAAGLILWRAPDGATGCPRLPDAQVTGRAARTGDHTDMGLPCELESPHGKTRHGAALLSVSPAKGRLNVFATTMRDRRG